uniref:Uncharacterized protein n=1 Tax=Lepeophtheirus salmonis TaxID=72036 RepID=A0A0K2VHY4_LEPSM
MYFISTWIALSRSSFPIKGDRSSNRFSIVSSTLPIHSFTSLRSSNALNRDSKCFRASNLREYPRSLKLLTISFPNGVAMTISGMNKETAFH